MTKLIKPLHKYLFFVLTLAVCLVSCSDNKFRIKGEIYGGENQTIVLEKPDFQGFWIPVDSVKINKNGGFSIAFPSPSSPEIFRLALNNQFVYFPVDFSETITLNTSFDKFGVDFSLAGSHDAIQMEKFEKELQKVNINNPDSMKLFKRGVYSTYMKDFPGSIINFYILTKTINGKPLYDTMDPDDWKYFGAAANGFKTAKPDDPHAALLEKVALETIKRKNAEKGMYKTVEANEISLIDIDLQDETGKNVKLSDVAGKGKKVAVIFSLLNIPESPELNIRLADIYRRHAGNVEFYNVSLDTDQYAWREAAKNLPWITVYSPEGVNSEYTRKYNIFQLPSFFIYDANGELVSRPMSLDELNKEL